MTNYDMDEIIRQRDKEKRDEYNKLIDGLIKQYISEGMSEFDARMKAVMSDESLAMVYPNGYDK
jgi:hypothetical protein